MIESLRQKGVRPVITPTGPAGLRLRRYAALLPCGTACLHLEHGVMEALHRKLGEEMLHFGVDVQLSPA